MINTISRLPQVLRARGGIGHSKHYEDIQLGLWTKPVAIGVRAKGWPDAETEKLNAARIAGLSHDDIRALVRRLEASRPNAFTVAELG